MISKRKVYGSMLLQRKMLHNSLTDGLKVLWLVTGSKSLSSKARYRKWFGKINKHTYYKDRFHHMYVIENVPVDKNENSLKNEMKDGEEQDYYC